MKKLFKNKVFLIISGVVVLLLIGVILLLVLLSMVKPSNKVINKKNTKEDIVEESIKSGSLAKIVYNYVSGYEKFNKDNYKLKIGEIDYNSDNKTDLVGVADDGNLKVALLFSIDEEQKEVKGIGSFGSENDVLGYTYSINEDKTYWSIDANGTDDVYVIKDDVIELVGNIDYKYNYYDVTNKYDNKKIIDRFVDVDLDKKKVDKEKLKEIEFSNEELLKNNNLTGEKIKENAEKAKEEKQKKDEEEKKAEEANKQQESPKPSQNSNSLTLNGFTIPFGKYTADPVILHQNIQLNSNGTANADGVECTWTRGSHDFAQDESSAGHPRESIILNCAGSTEYLSAFQNNELSDGDISNYNFVG